MAAKLYENWDTKDMNDAMNLDCKSPAKTIPFLIKVGCTQNPEDLWIRDDFKEEAKEELTL